MRVSESKDDGLVYTEWDLEVQNGSRCGNACYPTGVRSVRGVRRVQWQHGCQELIVAGLAYGHGADQRNLPVSWHPVFALQNKVDPPADFKRIRS
jgi:hypothetical protein